MNPSLFTDLVTTNIASLAFVLLALSGILFLLVVLLWLRLGALTRRYNAFMTGSDAASLEGLLEETLTRAREQSEALRDLRFALRQLETSQKRTIQRIGIVRFNAFPDTGSDLSFAVALLDGHGDGVVISSLYGREESRVYAKPVRGGRSTYHLTPEEEKAISEALAR